MNSRICTLVLLAGASCGLIRADSLNYTITGLGGGESLYQLTLTNTGTTGGTLFDLFVALPTPLANIDTGTIGTPAGWGDPSGGLLFFGPNGSPATSFIEWSAEFSGAHDVRIGNMLGGFSFTALQPITGPITFAVNGSTTFEPAVQGPPAPEPATFLLLLPLAVAVIVGKRVRLAGSGSV
jgi:hypothetical protein